MCIPIFWKTNFYNFIVNSNKIRAIVNDKYANKKTEKPDSQNQNNSIIFANLYKTFSIKKNSQTLIKIWNSRVTKKLFLANFIA